MVTAPLAVVCVCVDFVFAAVAYKAGKHGKVVGERSITGSGGGKGSRYYTGPVVRTCSQERNSSV